MTTYIKDLIDLPEKVHSGDFVLKLAEGIQNPDATLAPYVVTPQLADCFDGALEFIKSAVETGSSKATYLHGSFGSGKSHFMAVLHLLLEQNPAARAKEGLESVVTKHNPWLRGTQHQGQHQDGLKFLLVPYHMIGQTNMESALLGGYARRIKALHPEAPVPGVYRSEGLFHDAAELRQTLGDDAFFERLNRDLGTTGGWGELEGAWDGQSFDSALKAEPGSDERSRLVGALVQHYFKAYQDVARGSEEAYVPLDDGLSIISRHAQSLGYDALILFLDEIVLWFATRAADQSFLNDEGPKVSKLVEAETAERPIPIISFVARQRDLRELVGDGVTGAEQLSFNDVLRWWEARFHEITLEDRNLPEIAASRVLRPSSDIARDQIERSWRQTEKIRNEVLDILLTPNADRGVFRKVYPFSPAFIETLIGVSSVLQRERTALKVLLLLLVSQRDTLELGQIVPVGDLFDIIAEGDEPFTEGMRLHFENAKRLYYQKLLPMLEKEHELSEEQLAELPTHDRRARAFRADGRLLKTLLLGALVPEVEALKNLSSARLAALNHGSITSPIPGRERQEVLRRLRTWASQVGEIKIGDEIDPVITLKLTGVDTESILANAQAIDNPGNRRRKIRELLFDELGVEDLDEMFLRHEMLWRGTRRGFQVIFGNVRELTTESLTAKGSQRKAVLDFPFDEPGHSPAEDIARLDDFRQSGQTSRTLVWVPAFLSVEAQSELGTLVKLDDVLKNDASFRRHATHLSAFDQAQARELLRNQRSQLRHRMIRYLEGAYGVDNPVRGSIDESHRPASSFQSLDPTFTPQPPVGANLRQAFEQLLGQMLESQYPSHPSFGPELKLSLLRKIQGEVERSAQTPDGRIEIPKPLRPLMHQVAVPLKLGEMGDLHFVLGRHWYNHFNQHVQGEVTVGRLRASMDQPSPMGLPTLAQNLVIQLYADQTNRSFVLHGGPAHPKLESLHDELELRQQQLPSQDVWDIAVLRAGKILGLSASNLLNASNVSKLSEELRERAEQARQPCQAVKDRLAGLGAELGIDPAAWPRQQTADAVDALMRILVSSGGPERIDALAAAPVASSLDAMATSYKTAASVRAALESTRWELFDYIADLKGDHAPAAEAIRAELIDTLSRDEYAVSLVSRLSKLEGEAMRLLRPLAPAGLVQGKPPAPKPPPPDPGTEVLETSSCQGLVSGEAEKLLLELGQKVADDASIQLDVSWRLYRVKEPGESSGGSV